MEVDAVTVAAATQCLILIDTSL